EFHVPSPQLTLLYRGHAGANRDRLKSLRRAIAQGRRLRVHSYSAAQVLDVIAESDVVFVGADTLESILDVSALINRRDFRQRNLTIVDFNTFGSMSAGPLPEGVCLWKAADLENLVDTHAHELIRDRGFVGALDAAESWINHRVMM